METTTTCHNLVQCDRTPLRLPSLLQGRFVELYEIAFDCRENKPLHLLRTATSAKCKDPRDRIFALLGLLPPAISRSIQPHYTKPTKEVYREAFIAYVQCSGDLTLLREAGPSWIPDFRSSRKLSAGSEDTAVVILLLKSRFLTVMN
jgi:hypothetical protein